VENKRKRRKLRFKLVFLPENKDSQRFDALWQPFSRARRHAGRRRRAAGVYAEGTGRVWVKMKDAAFGSSFVLAMIPF
jgi:hypothetical protein